MGQKWVKNGYNKGKRRVKEGYKSKAQNTTQKHFVMRVVNGDSVTIEKKFIFIMIMIWIPLIQVTVKHEFCAAGCKQ